eukprot:GEMP01000359.1.p1 GENE.GEMP01000359.1~~GEMP01000359.1.p1  ORF type:complete len:1664 (-),score=340.51 GEMP01000359.1:2260-7251(-)
MWILFLALRARGKLDSLTFHYGTLEPAFNPDVQSYHLYVPECSEGFKYHLSDLKCEAKSGIDTEIVFQAGSYKTSSKTHCGATLGTDSGFTNYNFRGLVLKITTHDLQVPTTYDIHVVPSAKEPKQQCQFDPKGTIVLDNPPPPFQQEAACHVLHSTQHGNECVCNPGFSGKLHLIDNKWEGECVPSYALEEGSWPCTGEVPFVCGRCPTCEEADSIILDLETSCGIPLSVGVDNMVWHTQHSDIAMVNPDMRRNLCISPICRWRIELAHNAFALCQTLAGRNINSKINWRGQAHSFHTIKRLINILHKGKNDCHVVRSAQNICSSIMLHMKLLVSGIDVRSDATMREAESAYRTAFARVLNWPKRRMDVRVEPQLCSVDPVCVVNKCGYGACVPHWTKIETEESQSSGGGGWFGALGGLFGNNVKEDTATDLSNPENAAYGYRCLCNECFEECVIDGVRTCRRRPNCVAMDYCDPNPCQCQGQCIACPECEAQGEPPYTCKCPNFFTGPNCETFSCPAGYAEDNTGSVDHCSRVCTPIASTNPCDPNPCEHGGVCEKSDLVSGYHCQCATTWGGQRCEILKCGPGFFEQNGNCVAEREHFGGHQPTNCQDPCRNNPCQHEGVCAPLVQACTFQCQCVGGWRGTTCDLDPCSGNPCFNGQSCKRSAKSLAGYTCHCDEWCQKEKASRLGMQLSPFYDRRKKTESILQRRRQLEEAQRDIQFDWEMGGSIPFVRPLPDGPLPEENHCTVWQNDRDRRSEVVVTVKCPINDASRCEAMALKLEGMHQNHNFRELEHVARFGCIPTHVNASSEVTEEILMSNCPAWSTIEETWHQLYIGCNFASCNLAEDEEMQVIISASGAESVDQRFKENVCSLPMCRALIINFHLLFHNCRNSAPGDMGKYARKAKALYNFVHSCSNPRGIAVIRQQVKIIGVLDELSHTELCNAEKVVHRLVQEATAIGSDSELIIKARPALKSQNTVNARYIEPDGEFWPTKLPENPLNVPATPCTGLCVMTTQPGPNNDYAMDPSAHLFITFNEPIIPGDCWKAGGGGTCMVSLKVVGGSGETTVFDQLEQDMYKLDRLDDTLFISGETMFLKPWFTLKPFTNYTVTINPEVVKPVDSRILGLDEPFVYWFQSGPPAGSVVFISIALGCPDVDMCTEYSSKMQVFASSPAQHVVEPVRQSTAKVRAEQLRASGSKVSSRRLGDTMTEEEKDAEDDTPVPGIVESNFHDDVATVELLHEKRQLQQDAGPQVGGLAGPRGNAGNPLVELRAEGLKHCVPPGSWFFWNILSFVVFVMTILAVYCAGRAVSWWIQDAFSAHTGYFKSEMAEPKEPETKMTYWKSVVTENSWSCSRVMRGPAVWWPIVALITITLLWFMGYFWCHMGTGGWENGMICAATASTISCIVFCLMAVVAAVWANPGNIPFYPFKHRYKLSKEPWLETSWRDAPRPGQPGPRPGPGLTQKDSSPEGKPLAPPDPCAEGGPHEQRDSGMQEMMLKGVEYHESDKEIVFTIPKPKPSSRFQPDRLNDPYRKASVAAAWAGLLAIGAILLALLMIPMNAIHICPDQFYYIWYIAFIALIVSIIVRFICYCLTKRHCQFWDASKTAQAHEYLQLQTDDSRGTGGRQQQQTMDSRGGYRPTDTGGYSSGGGQSEGYATHQGTPY